MIFFSLRHIKKWWTGTSVLLTFMSATCSLAAKKLNFNPDWRFIREDIARAAAPNFDDGRWVKVSTPHTYNDVDTFEKRGLRR